MRSLFVDIPSQKTGDVLSCVCIIRKSVGVQYPHVLYGMSAALQAAVSCYRCTVELGGKSTFSVSRTVRTFLSDARTHGYGNGHSKIHFGRPMDTGMGVRQKWVRAPDGNGYGLYHGYIGYAKNAGAYLQMAPSCQHKVSMVPIYQTNQTTMACSRWREHSNSDQLGRNTASLLIESGSNFTMPTLVFEELPSFDLIHPSILYAVIT